MRVTYGARFVMGTSGKGVAKAYHQEAKAPRRLGLCKGPRWPVALSF